jgi:hypothetical protein
MTSTTAPAQVLAPVCLAMYTFPANRSVLSLPPVKTPNFRESSTFAHIIAPPFRSLCEVSLLSQLKYMMSTNHYNRFGKKSITGTFHYSDVS